MKHWSKLLLLAGIVAATLLVPAAHGRQGFAEPGAAWEVEFAGAAENAPLREAQPVVRLAQAGGPAGGPAGDAANVDRAVPVAAAEPSIDVVGQVIDVDGRPVLGAEVTVRSDEHAYVGQAGPDGRFRVSVPERGSGNLSLFAASADSQLMGMARTTFFPLGTHPVLVAVRPSLHVDVRVVDDQSQPIAGAQVVGRGSANFLTRGVTGPDGLARLYYCDDGMLTMWEVLAWKAGRGLNYQELPQPPRGDAFAIPIPRKAEQPAAVTVALSNARPLRMNVRDKRTGAPVADAVIGIWQLQRNTENRVAEDQIVSTYGIPELQARTGADGLAAFEWFPAWDMRDDASLRLTAPGYCETHWYCATIGEGPINIDLEPLVELRGRLVDPNGQPLANAAFQLSGRGLYASNVATSALRNLSFWATSNDNGEFRSLVAPYFAFELQLGNRQWAVPAEAPIVVSPGPPHDAGEFKLVPAIRVRGQVTAGDPPRPVPGVQMFLNRSAERVEIQMTDNNGALRSTLVSPEHVWTARTDRQGAVQFFVPPGKYRLADHDASHVFTPAIPELGRVPTAEFEITTGNVRVVPLHIPNASVLSGVVVDGDPPQPVAGVGVRAIGLNGPRETPRTFTDAEGRFTLLRSPWANMAVIVDDGLDARTGYLLVNADEDDVTLKLGPPGIVRGRLVQADGTPLANTPLHVAVQVDITTDNGNGRLSRSMMSANGSYANTNDRGEFTLPRLLPGELHYLYQLEPRDRGFSQSRIATFMSHPNGDPVDLGDIRIAGPRVQRAEPGSFEARYLANFESNETPQQRFDMLMGKQRLGNVRMLFTIAQPEHPLMREFYLLRLEDVALQTLLMDHYRTLALSTTWEYGEQSKELARKLNIDIPADGAPVMVVFDNEENIIARIDVDDWKTDGQPDGVKANAIFQALKYPPLDARLLLQAGLAQAKREDKRVLLLESTVWNGTWDLDFYLGRVRRILEQDYVIVRTDNRWLNHEAVMRKYRPEPLRLPWFCILDADGSVLVTADTAAQFNAAMLPIGGAAPINARGFGPAYPDSAQTADAFLRLFRSTRQRMTDDDLMQLKQKLYPSVYVKE